MVKSNRPDSLVWVIAVWAGGFAWAMAADAPAVREALRPLPAETQAAPASESLPDFANGLRGYLSFDRQINSRLPDGWEWSATFERNTPAYQPDLRRVDLLEPRFQPGKFGEGVMIEYGVNSAGAQSAQNLLPAGLADGNPAEVVAVGGATVARTEPAQGEFAMKIDAAAANGGFETRPLLATPQPNQMFSVYVKGTPGAKLNFSVQFAGQAAAPAAKPGETARPPGSAEMDFKEIGAGRAPLGDRWERVSFGFTVPGKAGEKKWTPLENARLRIRLTLDQPGFFCADALMLEVHVGYGGRSTPSTWIDGEQGRDGEILFLRPPNPATGTLAFWASPWGRMRWRCLLTVGDEWGWAPDLRLDLRDEKQFELCLPNKKGGKAALPDSAGWHHYAVTWKGAEVIAFFDGKPVITVPDAVPWEKLGALVIGGVRYNASPGARADAVFDEFAQWDRALSAEEIAALAARSAPLSAGMDSTLTVEDLEPVRVFARDQGTREWPLRIVNRGPEPLAPVTVTFGVEGIGEQTVKLKTVPARHADEVRLPWSPARLLTGKYPMKFRITAGDRELTHTKEIEIAPSRTPIQNAQIINWGGNGPDVAAVGMTVAGIDGSGNGPDARAVETSTRNRMYSQLRQFLTGRAQSQADHFVSCDGAEREIDQRSAYARADIERKSRVLAERLAGYPDVTHMIINTEHQWIGWMDFRPGTIEFVKSRFKLDLTPWTRFPAKDSWAVVHPMGRLSAARGGYAAPADGVVALDDPFYAFHRWWHSGEAGTEVFLNDTIAARVRERAPGVQVIVEPILRRPAVRAFKHEDLAEEWYYYPDPAVALWVQESLYAAARTTHARVTGMPQFLLKPGMAAPYGGMPTPHLFRQTVWLCAARPICGMTYWNLGGAINQGKANTPAEITTALGSETPDWKTAADKVKADGENSSLFLFIPELRDEIRRMHEEVIQPLGALLPAWENQPRKLAVYTSFAGQLFNEIRWPGRSGLHVAVESLPYPFDVLYDQDFESNSKLLESYSVLVVPQAAAITRPAADQIRAMVARGGVVVVDDYFRAGIDGVRKIVWQGAKEEDPMNAKLERELLKKYGRPDHPLYIEAMEQAAKKTVDEEGPTRKAVAMIREAIHSPVHTGARHVFGNLLSAGQANYLVAVNGLRAPGRYYGHFGKVLENGVAQAADFEIDAGLGKVAYELLAGREVALGRKDDATNICRLELGPASGSVVVFLPAAIDRMRVKADTSGLFRRGEVRIKANLSDRRKQGIPGIIPARVEIVRPDGQRDDLSHFDAFVDGELTLALPMALNGPAGQYTVEITELASGQKASASWKYKPRR